MHVFRNTVEITDFSKNMTLYISFDLSCRIDYEYEIIFMVGHFYWEIIVFKVTCM